MIKVKGTIGGVRMTQENQDHGAMPVFRVILDLKNVEYVIGKMRGRVEKWRGGLGGPIRPALSSAGASLALPCSVSTSRSSNRTCSFPASGFGEGSQAFLTAFVPLDSSNSFRLERVCLAGGSHTR